MWKALVEKSKWVDLCSSWSIGTSKSIDFWNNNWLQDVSPLSQFCRVSIHMEHKNLKLNDLVLNRSWNIWSCCFCILIL